MLSFVWPWAFWLLPLPVLMRWLVPPVRRQIAAIRSPLLAEFAVNHQHSARFGRVGSLIRVILASLMWFALVTALARPQYVGEPVVQPAQARDLMLAVDISGSMKELDMPSGSNWVTRLGAVKAVVGDFASYRRGDRLGLILFGSQAYLQTPLTFDHKTLNQLLREALIGFAGTGTAIGDAIGLAVKHLQDRPSKQRVLVLITDGANTDGVLNPLEAAQAAADAKVKIYTIGVGSPQFARGPQLDERTLIGIAQITGGDYFRARDPLEMANAYRTIDALEPIEQEGETIRPVEALYHLSLALAALLALLTWVGLRRSGSAW